MSPRMSSDYLSRTVVASVGPSVGRPTASRAMNDIFVHINIYICIYKFLFLEKYYIFRVGKMNNSSVVIQGGCAVIAVVPGERERERERKRGRERVCERERVNGRTRIPIKFFRVHGGDGDDRSSSFLSAIKIM